MDDKEEIEEMIPEEETVEENTEEEILEEKAEEEETPKEESEEVEETVAEEVTTEVEEMMPEEEKNEEDIPVDEDKEEKETPVEEVKEEKVEELTTNDSEVKTEEKKKKCPIGIIILLILLLALIVLGVVMFVLPRKSESVKEETDKATVNSPYRLEGNDLADFDLYFLQLENPSKNMIYSPLSIKYALAMLNEGTDGESHKQIEALIGDYKAKKYPNSANMSFANAMFIRDTFKNAVKENYTNTLKDKYNADVITDSFESADTINNWVSDKTFNLVKKLVTDDSVKQGNFFLVNALAIDMNWKNRIQASHAPLPDGMNQTWYHVSYIHEKYSDYISVIEDEMYPSMEFNGVENIKSVKVGASFNHYDIIKDKGEENIRKTVTEDYEQYLIDHPEQVEPCPSVEEYVNDYITEIGENYKKTETSTDFYISDNNDEKVFAKDLQTYDGVTLQYVGIMPKNEALNTYAKNITAEKLSTIIKNMKEVKYENFKEGVITQIKGNIPLFNYDYELNLLNDLKSLGVEDVFDIQKADLSKMVKEKQAIFDAVHKANIEFSNDGIKAAAATAMGGAGASRACGYDYIYEVPVEVIDVTFDKPYLYVIRDKDSGEVWFVGTVYEPIHN